MEQGELSRQRSPPILYRRGRAVERPPRPRLPSPYSRLDVLGWGTGGGGKENYGKQLISETSAYAAGSIPELGTPQEESAAPSRGTPRGSGRGQPAAAAPVLGTARLEAAVTSLAGTSHI